VKIVAQLEHDQLTPSGLMVHDHHPADPASPPRLMGRPRSDAARGDRTCAGSRWSAVERPVAATAIATNTYPLEEQVIPADRGGGSSGALTAGAATRQKVL
jgi:hypothetical protein